jgi:hypothetical protein
MIKASKISEISTYSIEYNNEMYFVEMSVSKTGYKISVSSKNGETIHDYDTIQNIETYIFDNFINKQKDFR